MTSIPVSEVFGPVIQGEGPLAGVPTSFIRVAGCDYRCSWCDTPYAVLPELWSRSARRAELSVLADEAASLGTEWVTISGGNPAIYHLDELVAELHAHHLLVSLETQGSARPEWIFEIDQVVVSPKPPSSGWSDRSETDFARFADWLFTDDRDWTRDPALKIVVFNEHDLLWAYGLAAEHWPDTLPLYLSVGTTPGGDLDAARRDVGDRLRWLMERVGQLHTLREVRVLPQLHVLAYGHARGV